MYRDVVPITREAAGLEFGSSEPGPEPGKDGEVVDWVVRMARDAGGRTFPRRHRRVNAATCTPGLLDALGRHAWRRSTKTLPPAR